MRAFSDFENDDVRYWMRYRCGTEIIGPFGPVYQWYYVRAVEVKLLWLSH